MVEEAVEGVQELEAPVDLVIHRWREGLGVAGLFDVFFRDSPAHIRYALDQCPPSVLHLAV